MGRRGIEYLVHIDAPASLDLRDEVVTIYGALGVGEDERELARIAVGDLAGSTDSSTFYKLRVGDDISDWKVKPGDLLVVEYKGPDFEGDILANAYLNQVRFRDNYKTDPLSIELLLSTDYPVYRPYLEDLFHEQIAEIYALYRDDSIPVLQEVMREGLFTGITGMQALGRSSKREERQFLRYANEHLGSYMGTNYKFSEAYATWIIQNAPMSDEQYRDYFLSFSDSSRFQVVEGYIKQIQNKQLLAEWIEDASEALIDRQLPLALSLTELCLDVATLTLDDLRKAEILLLQARIYLEFNQDQRSLKLAEEAVLLYDRSGDIQGLQTARSFIADLREGNKAEVIVQSGHTMPFELVFHPDGQYYYTGGWDGFIKMWDYRSGMIVKEVNAHELMINSLSVSRDGRYLVSVDDMGYCKLLNAYTLEEIWTYRHKTEFIGEADINSDGTLIALCGGDEFVYVLSVKERNLIQKLKRHKGNVTSVRFHPENDILMSAGRDSMVYTWNLPDFSERGWYRDGSQIYHIALSPDGRTFMLVRKDSSISFWDFYDASRLGVSTTTFKRMGTSVFFAKPCFSPDNRYAVYMYEGERSYISFLRLADLTTHNFNNPHEDQISTLCFHPGGSALISSGHDLVVKTYDLSNYHFRETGTLRIVTNRPPAAPAIQVRFDTSGTHLLALISARKFTLTDLDLVNGERRLLQRSLLIGDQQKFVHDGDNSIRYFDTDRKLHVRNFKDRTDQVTATGLDDVDYYEFYPDMSKVCMRLLSDGSFRVVETVSGKTLKHIPLPNSTNLRTIYNFTLIPEEDIVYAACNSHSLIRIDLKSGKVDSITLGKKGRLEVIGVLRTADPEILLLHANRFVGLWNRISGKWKWKHVTDPDEEVYTSVAVSSDLSYVALASYTYRVEVVNVIEGKTVWERTDFGYFISNLAFNPKYPLLAVSCEDMRLSVFDYLAGSRVFQIFPQQDGDLILMDDEGSYWADKRSLNGLAYKVRTSIYPVEQFDVLYNRPDKVLSNSPCADPIYLKALEQAVTRRLEREGVRMDPITFALPNTLIANRNTIPTLTKMRKLELEVECSDYVDSLSRVHVNINGVPVLGSNGKRIACKHFSRERISLELGYGANQIKAWCSNSSGLRSLRESLEINVTLETPRPDLYIGAMAVSDYQDDGYDLKYPVKDAGDLIRQLKIDTSAYGRIFVKTLFDEEATRKNLEQLQEFFSGCGVQDRAVLFISGHGVLDDHYQFYFASSDLDFRSCRERYQLS
ncbi:MAG: WD40 repeat domain-containing protein [Flavobacteriales bacterium]|nr:WD40 repeat domain-containing protein [Flavobacteriales bacterium]